MFSNDPQYRYVQMRKLILNGQEADPAPNDVLKEDFRNRQTGSKPAP